MKFVFSGRDVPFLRCLAGRICTMNDKTDFYDEPLEMLADILDGRNAPDILILDINLYRHFRSYIYKYFFEADRKIPMIFYNDPDVKPGHRILRWLSENEIQYECIEFEHLLPLFGKIDRELQNIRLRNERTEICARTRHCILSPAMHRFFGILQECGHRDISIDEIARKLKINEKDRIRRNNIAYSYIARLRKCFENNSNVEIVRTGKGCYRLEIFGLCSL